ncbi:MAG: hypothetical protein M3R55_12010 [Acidobacteriota bacterium]|nr:hypothetical protein [Acidobacteriota bacterium]
MTKLADLVFVAAAVALVWFIAVNRSTASEGPAARTVLTPGTSYDGMAVNPGRRSVVLVISPSCRFCIESMDFYKRLLASAPGRDVDVVFHSPTSAEQTKAFLSTYGVRNARLLNVRLPSAITGTPATIVLDSAGRVVGGWLGKLTTLQEREVFALLD